MKRSAVLSLLFITLPVVASTYTPRQAVIVMTRTASTLTVRSLATMFEPGAADARDVRDLPIIHGFAANLTEEEIATLKASGDVVLIEPDRERRAFSDDTVTPGRQTIPYGLRAIGAPEVWQVTRGKSLNGGPPIHVAIIDTGIDYKNPELATAFKEGFNFISRTSDPFDDSGHGSHVAGTIAAADDQTGVVGVAPDVDLYALKAFNACAQGSTSAIIAALNWVVDKKKSIGGNWIMNLSFGSSEPSAAEENALAAANAAGILAFAAPGNGYPDSVGIAYPAAYSTVVSVGAVDSSNQIASFSQRGSDLKLVAPGVSVLSTTLTGLVAADDGRKFVAPFADGFLANGNMLCLSRGPVTAKYVAVGTGNTSEIPPSVSGKIALIERGGADAAGTLLTLLAKTRNAQAKGAIGVVLYTDSRPAAAPTFLNLTTADASTFPPTVMLERAYGLSILATPDATLTMRFDSGGAIGIFDLYDGTSQACPHAVGAAALAWAVSPNSTATQVATAIEQTAIDLGDPGVDNTYGFGLVNAAAAARRLNPSAFAVRGRFAGRRGH